MDVGSAVKQVRNGFALIGVPIAPTEFVKLVDALLDAAKPPAPVPAMLSAFVSRIGLTHPKPKNDKDMAHELLVIFASMLQHAEDMAEVRGGGDRGANSGVAAMLSIIARLGCYATDTAVQTAFINTLSENGLSSSEFNELVVKLIQPANGVLKGDIGRLVPASVPPVLPPAERPGDRKIVRKIDLLLQAEALKMKGNAGGIGIVPPMPSIFAKYYVNEYLDNPEKAAREAKDGIVSFTRAEQARQIRLVPRRCAIPRDGHLAASRWAELYDALDLAISPLPLQPIAPGPAPESLATEQRPPGENNLYEWENELYGKEVSYRLADRNRHRR